MALCVSLLYILFTVEFLLNCSTGLPHLELGVSFTEEPSNVIGIKGKPLGLPCTPRLTHQKELLEIKWYHDNKPMDFTNDKRRTVLQNGTLFFSKLVHKRSGHSDQGEYRCVVVRENGSLSSKPGFLRISVLPGNFSRHPIAQNVTTGSNVHLFCEIESSPELEIEWEKDDHKLPQNALKYATISGPDVHGSILYIFNVVPDDSGSYRCTAKNVLLNKQRHSSSGLLTVLPQVNGFTHRSLTFLSAQEYFSSFSTLVREVKEGDNITLDCVANGYPTPTLTWKFLQFGRNKPQPVFNATIAGYNIVRITNISQSQAGRYTCSAMNFSKKELTVLVKVLTPPKILEKSDSIVFRASKTVRFRCVLYGNPVPDISWLKDGTTFNITGRIKHRTSVNDSQDVRISELIVSSTVANDAGIYQCLVKNSVGSTWAASRLFLNATKPAPKAPEKVACESVSSSQIKLTWEVPDSVGKVMAFSAHYHLTDNGEEMQKVIPHESRSIQIGKLLPFTNYTFYLRLYIDSASEFSEKAVCQTGEEVPTDAPKMKLKMINPNSIRVSWVPLPKEKARGVINQYKIQWRVTRSPSSKVDLVTSDVLQYTITGLLPGKKYDVRVLAATSKGWPNSDLPWETFEVPSNYNSNIPPAPEVLLRAINSSSIEVKWNLSKKNAQIYGYKIFYRKQNGNQMGPLTVPADTNRYVLTKLDPETWYEIMVLGVTKEEEGESGVNSIHTLSVEGSSKQSTLNFPSILEPPVALEADPISSMAVNLTWSPPNTLLGASYINYYNVCFSTVQTSRNKNVTVNCIKSLENRISVTDLKPYTLYEFKVSSHDKNNKQSVFSQAVECHTLEDVPSQVVDISWKALNKTSIQVTWKEPRQSNGIIKNYFLYYTQDASSSLDLWDVKMVPGYTRRTELTGLNANVRYYLIIRASTSAGRGPYGSPQELLIPSPKTDFRDEPIPKTSKDKQNDHYIGIVVGLGIGLCCIVLCTICILCRRRCLKRQVSQEFEITSNRHSNGNSCQRDRELVMESRETEYFTFLSSQSEGSNVMETSVQHLDTKGHYPNGSTKGLRTSLLSETIAPNAGSRKANIYITENPRYDPKSSYSPLLSPKAPSTSSGDREVLQDLKRSGDLRSESKTLFLDGDYLSDSDKSFSLKNNDTKCSEYTDKDESPNYSNHSFSLKNQGNVSVQNNIENWRDSKLTCGENYSNHNLNEENPCLVENSVLSNPEFRFSDFPEKPVKRNGFVIPNNFYNNTIEVHCFNDNSSSNRNEDIKNQIYGIYRKSKLSLHLVSKEIIQES